VSAHRGFIETVIVDGGQTGLTLSYYLGPDRPRTRRAGACTRRRALACDAAERLRVGDVVADPPPARHAPLPACPAPFRPWS